MTRTNTLWRQAKIINQLRKVVEKTQASQAQIVNVPVPSKLICEVRCSTWLAWPNDAPQWTLKKLSSTEVNELIGTHPYINEKVPHLVQGNWVWQVSSLDHGAQFLFVDFKPYSNREMERLIKRRKRIRELLRK